MAEIGKLDIIVVDDDAMNLELFSTFFRVRTNVVPRCCKSMAELSQSLSSGVRPAVALVDYGLTAPHTGYDACREITSVAPHCQLFIISGDTSVAQEYEPTDLTVAGFFQKPFSFEQIVSSIVERVEDLASKPMLLTCHPQPKNDQLIEIEAKLAKEPGNETLRQMLAFSCYVAGDYARAKAVYGELLARGGRSFLVYYYLGHVYARLRDYGRAVECWGEAMKRATSPDVLERVLTRIRMGTEMLGWVDLRESLCTGD